MHETDRSIEAAIGMRNGKKYHKFRSGAVASF
jgi:hypothetical protein